MIEWACKSQRHVTRSTFAAELLSAGDAVDQGILVSQLMMETVSGPVSASTARQLRDNGGYSPMALYIDAKSVYLGSIGYNDSSTSRQIITVPRPVSS